MELDLTPGVLDKTNDPVRLYLREMGVVPLLRVRARSPLPSASSAASSVRRRRISRSPVAIAEILKIGESSLKGRSRSARW